MKIGVFLIVVGFVAINIAGRVHPRDGYAPRPPRVAHVSWQNGDTPAAVKIAPGPRSPRVEPKPSQRGKIREVVPAMPPIDPKKIPDWFPRTLDDEQTAAKKPDQAGAIVLMSVRSATEAKARADLRTRIEQEAITWIAGDVPQGWKPPSATIDALILATHVRPIVEDLSDLPGTDKEIYTIYRAAARVDASPRARAIILAAHDQQVVRSRMFTGAGIVGAVLIVLGVIAGYIRADEATGGGFTNRLRLASAACVGAAGVALYQYLV